jgi:hypothetical protein
MSLFSAFVNARLPKTDTAPQAETEGDSQRPDSPGGDANAGGSKVSDLDDHIFDLLPPKPVESDGAQDPEPQQAFLQEGALQEGALQEGGLQEAGLQESWLHEPEPQSRNVHPVDMTDLSRLSIDRDGRLYWDGKPVEVRRRISMSRAQVIGASIIAAFVVIGAVASAVQGVVAARDLSCRFGWSADACTVPGGLRQNRSDIPA